MTLTSIAFQFMTTNKFVDQVCVVTDAASGTGLAVARAFAEGGARVVLADVEEGALQNAVATLAGEGHDVLGGATNVASRSLLSTPLRMAQVSGARL